jgi:hypothetical protein
MAYNNYVQDGCVMEVVFERFLSQHKATFKLVNPNLNSRQLVNLALKTYPKKVESYLRNSGRQVNSLLEKEADWLLDTFFNTDYLLEVEVEDRTLVVAVDVTLNPEKLSHKEFSMGKTKSVFPTLGIDMGLVILISEEVNFTDKESSYKIAGQILMAIEDLWFDEKTVGTVVI